MEPTRRLWSVAGLAVVVAVLALLFSRVLLLGVPLGVGLWVLAHQVSFTRALGDVADAAPLEQSLTPDTALVDDTVLLTVELSDETGRLRALNARVTVDPPAALDLEEEPTHEVTEASQTVTVPLRIGVAGSYSVDAPVVECTSPGGLFRETLRLGNECTVTGEPRVPRGIHIGTGGQQIAVAYGEHDAEQGGAGFEPGELRQYYPGDPTNRIDWNATARLDEPYVREFKAETIRQTQLVVDTRDQMLDGPRGRSKLDYAREVAVSITEYVAGLEDPLGVMLVGDEHVRGPTSPLASTQHYKRIRRQLLDLATNPEPASTGVRDVSNWRRNGPPRTFKTGRDAQRIAADPGDDAYSQTLAPYFRDVESYADRLADQPLFRSVNERIDERAGDSWIVIVTDDSNREEVLETVRAAAIRDIHVSVFLLPSVLFSEDGLTDLERAYDDYVDFESFRQRLAAINNVNAFEVGPHERFSALLETAQTEGVRQ